MYPSLFQSLMDEHENPTPEIENPTVSVAPKPLLHLSQRDVSIFFFEQVPVDEGNKKEDVVAKDAAEIECTCWQHKEDRPKGAFSAPCASPNCVYAYVNSGQQSFEQFKIQLGNVNKFVTVKVWFN